MCLGIAREPPEERQVEQQQQQFTGAHKWKQLMAAFRKEIQVKRRRKMFKIFEDCFTGEEAVEWLQVYLREHEVTYRRLVDFDSPQDSPCSPLGE